MLSNKKLNPIVTQVSVFRRNVRCRKINMSFAFIIQSYFLMPKNIRLNPTHYFILKIANKIMKIAFNHSSDIDFKDFVNLYKKCILKPYFYLVIDVILASDNHIRFRKNLSEEYKS